MRKRKKSYSHNSSLKGSLSFCFHSHARTPLLLLCYHKKTHRQWGILFVFSIFSCHFSPPAPHYRHLFILPCSVLLSFQSKKFSQLSEPHLLFILLFLCHFSMCLYFSLPLFGAFRQFSFFIFSLCSFLIPSLFSTFPMEKPESH